MNTPIGGDRIPTKPFRVYWERGPQKRAWVVQHPRQGHRICAMPAPRSKALRPQWHPNCLAAILVDENGDGPGVRVRKSGLEQ